MYGIDKKQPPIRRKRRIPVSTPTGFTWTNHPLDGKLFTDGEGTFWIENFDVSLYQWTGKTYYVSLARGSDTNDGLSTFTPFKSVKKAVSMADVAVVMVEGGYYDWRNAFNNSTVQKNVSIKAMPGHDVKLSTRDLIASWTLEPGTTNTYHGSITVTGIAVGNVFDASIKDINGEYQKLTLRASIADVEANPGSYFVNGLDVYVRTSDSRTADSNVFVFLSVNNLRHFLVNGTVYLEGIKFEGGKQCVLVENGTGVEPQYFYAKNCSFKYSDLSNGLSIKGSEIAILQGCVAAKNYDDGFNYHIDGLIPKAIEIDCIGRDNGVTSDTDNGSTMHEGGKIIRLNGSYFRNKGPNVADVSDNTESWNLGCAAFSSLSSASAQKTDFTCDNVSKMWLDSCLSYGSDFSLDARTGSTIYVRNVKTDGPESIVGTKVRY